MVDHSLHYRATIKRNLRILFGQQISFESTY